VVRDDLSVAEIKAARLADNRSAESPFDEEALRLEFEALMEHDFDLSLTAFDLPEIEELLAAGEPEQTGLTEDEKVPETPEQPITRPGDLWILGDHRVLCGDATVLSDVEQVLGGQLADLCWTDPPYSVRYGDSAKDKLRGKHRPILNDDLGQNFGPFLYDVCVNVLAVTKGACYICMGSSELHTLREAFTAAGGRWSDYLVWAKSHFTLGRADYQRQYEPILYGWKDGSDHYWCGARDQGDVWFFEKPAKNDLHPTMKPVALVERAIRNSSKSRDIVLDPFGGSGSTLIACEKAGRHARLIELDPRYVDTIIERWQRFTGECARHAETGDSFPDSIEGSASPSGDRMRSVAQGKPARPSAMR
jgi:DNA modification methylase